MKRTYLLSCVYLNLIFGLLAQSICEVEIDGDSITCFYYTTQILEASPSSVSQPLVSYYWYSPGQNSIQGTGQILTITNPGEYCVIASDSLNTCQDTACIIVSVQEIDIFTAPSPAIICLGDSIVMEIDTFWNDIIWSSGDTMDRIVHDPLQTTTYVVEAYDTFGCEGRGEIIVQVDSCATNIVEHSSSLSIYPNPLEQFSNIQLPSKRFTLRIYDILGNKIREAQVRGTTLIKRGDLKKGIYIIVANSEDQKYRAKLIVN